MLLEMERTTRKFLASHTVPDYVVLLLELYGVTHITDLTEFGEEDVSDIVLKVRDCSIFPFAVDFQSKSNRIKFLGFEFAEVGLFDFGPLIKKKLLKLSAAAISEIEASTTQKKR